MGGSSTAVKRLETEKRRKEISHCPKMKREEKGSKREVGDVG